MKLAVISDCRSPTGPVGHHGLGRSAYDIAVGLANAGHDVTLYAGRNSDYHHGPLQVYDDESVLARQIIRNGLADYDAVLDTSHGHYLSWYAETEGGDPPVLNRMADRECRQHRPNMVVNSRYMNGFFPQARQVRTGIDIRGIPFYDGAEEYLVYASSWHTHKGMSDAIRAADMASTRLRVLNNKTGPDFWSIMGQARGLLHPSTIDAAPRLPLEAAACGVPTLCYEGDGTADHVADGKTGFHCTGLEDMVRKIGRLDGLDRRACRDHVRRRHGYADMVVDYEQLLFNLVSGERW